MASVAGSRASWLLLGGLAAGVGLQPYVGCLPDETGTDPVDEQTGDLVTDLQAKVVSPALTAFRDDAAALREAIVAWQGGGAREDVRPAFLAAMDTWQQVELLQIGPAGSSLTTLGGEDLRDEVYSWPTVNPCRIDQVTVSRDYEAADFFEVNLVNAYGLDALEHLLYAPEGDNVCPNQVDINASGDWDALGPDGVSERRAAYALAVVDGILATTDTLLDRWDPAGGDFAATLRDAGTEQALDAVFRGQFYLELVVKDQKLAGPLAGDPAEGEASGQSAAWVAANLRGFRTLFTGADGVGFDDVLTDQGHADLSEKILADTDAALALAEQGALDQALYDAVKLVTDDLKGDLLTVLSLQLPTEAAGDND